MSARGRSTSPHPLRDEDIEMDTSSNHEKADLGNSNGLNKPGSKVVIVTNLTRSVVQEHLQMIFGFYGEIVKLDLPLFGKSGQNRGKAALEYSDAASAQKAFSHMNGGQLDGATLKVELSDLPIRPQRVSRSPPPRTRNGRGDGRGGRGDARPYSRSRSRSRSPSRVRSWSRSRSRSRSPRYSRRRDTYEPPRYGGYGGRGGGRFGAGGRGGRGSGRGGYRQSSRARSPPRRGVGPSRRRSPSYERGGYGRRRTRSPSHSVRSSRSRTRSYSRSRSRSPRSRSWTRSMSYSSYSRYSRSRSRSKSRSRSRSVSRGRRSRSIDDIRDSRSRSKSPRN